MATLRHKLSLTTNLLKIALATLNSNGPLLTFKRAKNFVKSGRFKETVVNSLKPIKEITQQNYFSEQVSETLDLLLVTHLWNTSGVPMLTGLLHDYFSFHRITTGIWSEADPEVLDSRVIGAGSVEAIANSLQTFPKIVFINTTCISAQLFEFFLEIISTKKTEKLILYSHEGIMVLSKNVLAQLQKIPKSKVEIFAGSRKTALLLKKSLPGIDVRSVPYQIIESSTVASLMKLNRIRDFSSIRILLVGRTSDSRKRHIFSAKTVYWANQIVSIQNFFSKDRKIPEIKLKIIGAQLNPNMDDVSKRVKKILQKNVVLKPVLLGDDYIQEFADSNAVICLSDYETLPMYVSHAMARGCIVLKNDTGGTFEQLWKNGVRLGSSAIYNGFKLWKIAGASERALEEMSTASRMRFLEVHCNSWDEHFLPCIVNSES